MRTIVISCSEKKIASSLPIPVIDIYDGPYFKTLRKLKREGLFPEDVKVFVISAKYGLLQLNDTIMSYDQHMTKNRASQLAYKVVNDLINAIKEDVSKELVVNLGADYMPSLNEIENYLPDYCRLIFFTGTIIQRRKQLKEYLLNGLPRE